MKLENGIFDAQKTPIGYFLVSALFVGFLFGIFLIGHSVLSLIEREIIDDRMLKESKVLQGYVVSYEERKAARGPRLFWVPIVRVSAGATVVDIPDQHKFFDSKPHVSAINQQFVTVDFLTELSILRVRESYSTDKQRLIRNDLISLLLGVLMSALLPFAWIRRRKTSKPEAKE